ncbi:hypothetical protein UCMB321_1873 [Pseudomonas batumici]|uniref:Uncharacterized protein n=1 Tax=Pseudomonas batumici TaxID=226910 RepID=A0A0C2EE99_9PSED|nr:hypothetical protein UCMB321_1873 [Pseudomonas batumici]
MFLFVSFDLIHICLVAIGAAVTFPRHSASLLHWQDEVWVKWQDMPL